MNNENEFKRTEMLIGSNALDTLKSSKVAIFGIGGVGGYVCEGLSRSGIGRLDLFDNDTVSVSNINRQIIALHSTVNQPKVEVMKQRILDINPYADVRTYQTFYLPENADNYNLDEFDYIVDAIDTISAKLELIVRAKNSNVPIISSMGAGNKLDPTLFEVSDIYSTSVCPLARVMRRELKSRNIEGVKVVYSKEKAMKPNNSEVDPITGKVTPGSISFVPSVAGLIIASEVIRDLINKI